MLHELVFAMSVRCTGAAASLDKLSAGRECEWATGCIQSTGAANWQTIQHDEERRHRHAQLIPNVSQEQVPAV